MSAAAMPNGSADAEMQPLTTPNVHVNVPVINMFEWSPKWDKQLVDTVCISYCSNGPRRQTATEMLGSYQFVYKLACRSSVKRC